MVLIKNEVTLMYKIFWSHVFALGIILSITSEDTLHKLAFTSMKMQPKVVNE